jgi:DNA-directed RNA polymerase subunit M
MGLFCPECKALLFPAQGLLACRKCGYETKLEEFREEPAPVKEEVHHKMEPLIVDEELGTMPQTRVECPACGHKKAYYRLIQIRAADEPSTYIYRCVSCKHTWRRE